MAISCVQLHALESANLPPIRAPLLRRPAIQMVGSARHCNFPGTGPNTPMDQVLEVATRNLERTCVILLTVSMPFLARLFTCQRQRCSDVCV